MSMRAVITYIIYAFTLYRSNNEFDSIWMGIYNICTVSASSSSVEMTRRDHKSDNDVITYIQAFRGRNIGPVPVLSDLPTPGNPASNECIHSLLNIPKPPPTVKRANLVGT